MSGVSKKLMGTTAAGGGFTAIEDVFSTYLYTGNSSARTITNGIDLAGEGGLLWLKWRSGNNAFGNALYDTERGVTKQLVSNATSAETTENRVSSFNSDGFSLTSNTETNLSANDYASWTFRKAPRFFDVVTYTGTGSARTVDHNLGTTVGSIIIKRTDTTSNWAVYHRGNTAAPETDFLSLNLTNATADDATYWNDTAPTDSVFTVGTNAAVNASGGTYVAYLFAHDPLGPSEDGSDGLIACGSYTGTGAADGPEIDLGWEPQWVMIKHADGPDYWVMFDSMRGIVTGGGESTLVANESWGESVLGSTDFIELQAKGFKPTNASTFVNGSGGNYIYIAIRRGPMRVPESGTEVFDVQADTKTQPYTRTFAFPPDLVLVENRGSPRHYIVDRLRGKQARISTHTTDAEQVGSDFVTLDAQDSVTVANLHGGSYSSLDYAFRRAPEFFDVVAYTGDGVAGRTVPHNLGVAPELIIAKPRDQVRGWPTYWLPLGPTFTTYLNLTALPTSGPNMWNSTNPSDTTFTVGNDADINASGFKYIAYLFSTLAGISKVGSYTGNGSSQTIDCGFTSGARFILIKRTDDNDDWYVWDTARGIVAANDPHLSLNTTAAEVTTDDSVDPDSSGFIVNQVAATNINVSAASYIFYAVA